jgi:hypothetical protein
MRTLTISEAAQRAPFETEALRHLDALYSFVLKLSRVRDDAEELVSVAVHDPVSRVRQPMRCRTSIARQSCSATSGSCATRRSGSCSAFLKAR